MCTWHHTAQVCCEYTKQSSIRMNSPSAYQMLVSVFNHEPVLNVVLMCLYCDNPTLDVIDDAMCV